MSGEDALRAALDAYGGRSIEDIQRRHRPHHVGHDRDEVCEGCGLMWPCDVAVVFAKWDADEARVRNVTLDYVRDRVKGLTSRKGLRHKADDPTSSYDPLLRETVVLAAIEVFRP